MIHSSPRAEQSSPQSTGTSAEGLSLAKLISSRLRTPRLVALVISLLILGAAAVFSIVRATDIDPLVPLGDHDTVTQEPDATAVSEMAITVHIVGAVQRPGVYELAAGARVHDAIERAGGAQPEAAAASLNLARTLVDGEQIIIPTEAEYQAQVLVDSQSADQSGVASSSSVINLNTANHDQLDSLPGIGPALAQRILDWRGANGPFASVDQLSDVSGIGSKLVETLRLLVTT